MDAARFLGYVGALNLAVLAAATFARARDDGRNLLLALFLALSGAAIAGVLVSHDLEGIGERLAVVAEHVATIALAPTLYCYVCATVGRPARRLELALLYAPAALFLLLGAPVVGLGWKEPPAPALVVGYHAAFTGAALVVFLRFRSRPAQDAHDLRWPALAIGASITVHAGQIARLAGLPADAGGNLVPLLGGLGAMCALFLGLATVEAAQRRIGARYAKSGHDARRLRQCYEAMMRALEEQELYRRTDLSLATLAAAAGVPVKLASQALSGIGATSFHAVVARLRVGDARRRLLAPENAGVAVEAIGMEAGFRSRSAFYDAFQDATGMTPAEFRRASAKIVCAPIGEDTKEADPTAGAR